MAGAAPSFGDMHVVRTLFLLQKKTGRKRLVRHLGIGEGSVRTILKKLAADGLITSSRGGQQLSAKGMKKVAELQRNFTAPTPFEAADIEDLGAAMLVTAHKAADRVSTGVVERDLALKAGADGAIIFIYGDDGIGFPDGTQVMLEETAAALEEKELRDGDVAIIAFAETPAKAEDGAVAVALALADVTV